jgi:hypothetical protein
MVEQAETQLRVVVPIEEEEEDRIVITLYKYDNRDNNNNNNNNNNTLGLQARGMYHVAQYRFERRTTRIQDPQNTSSESLPFFCDECLQEVDQEIILERTTHAVTLDMFPVRKCVQLPY